ncbi:hypothetical protein DFH07DRAFT_772309 [Mycena maculata]|uniref:Uncharacterized protein n=1 Tax=Mycena maculata TaxID=230809 RepID=A0AAD7NGI2_9AGAR|nr:hypothetical protein DFH07DRAFT_772309 [Mycena maculata]
MAALWMAAIFSNVQFPVYRTGGAPSLCASGLERLKLGSHKAMTARMFSALKTIAEPKMAHREHIEFKKRTLRRSDHKDHLRVCGGESLQFLKPHEDVLDELAEKWYGKSWGCLAKLSAPCEELVDGREKFGKLPITEPAQPSRHRAPDFEICLQRVPPHHVKVGVRPFLGNDGHMTVALRPLLGPEGRVVSPIPHVRPEENHVRELERGNSGDIVGVGRNEIVLRSELSNSCNFPIEGPQRNC